jgi:hypothetical protein
MPIRLRDSSAVVGRLRATTEDAAASIAGTHVEPPSVSGSVVTRLGDVVCALVASFTPVATRTGVIATTLEHCVAAEFGTSAPPPIPNRSGSIGTTLAGVTCALRGTHVPPQQAVPGYWPNWPIMNTTLLQANNLLDSTEHAQLADKDLVMFQSFYPTTSRLQSRIAAINAIKALQAGSAIDTKFFMYLTPSETYKVMPSPTGNNEKEVNKALIDDPVKGNSRWIVHRVGNTGLSGRCEAEFNPTDYHQVNMAVLVSGVNSLGENYATAFWKEWDARLHIGANDIRPLLSGIFHDVCVQRPAPLSQNNGATNVTDPDYNQDGVADVMTDFTTAVNAGGRMICQGELEVKARFEAQFPGWYLIPNAATWDTDYTQGFGLRPMSTAHYYRRWEFHLDELANFQLGLRIATGGASYIFNGGGSASPFFRAYNINERFLKLDANIPAAIGKGAVLVHSNGIDRVPQSTDIDFMRFTSLICLLVERAAPCTQLTGNRVFQLDEMLLELGNPLAVRSMGTLNESTLAWSLRAADFSSGAARFYWARFEKGIVLARLDIPSVGPWPSADAAVSCPLPTPPAGKKWQRINSATYVNPVTGAAMRGQNTTINNGADVTSVSLRPYHAVAIRLVNV